MAATTTYAQLTLLEIGKRKDPNGEMTVIVESLSEDNEILQDSIHQEANNGMAHKTTRRTTQPTGSFRQLNKGVATETSQTIEVNEGVAMLESYAEVDKALADMTGNPDSVRNQESKGFIEGMGQTLAGKMIYGNSATTVEEFDGLATRMGSLAATANVVGQGGTGSDLTSIYIAMWDQNKFFMIYPTGHKSAGIEHRNLGEDTNTDSNGLKHQIYRDWFGIKIGMVVRDDRAIARLANIEDGGTSNTFDEDNLITLLNRMPKSGKGSKLYVNDTVQTQMEIKLKDKQNVYYTANMGEGLAGEPVLKFRGCKVRKVDQITITEAAIS